MEAGKRRKPHFDGGLALIESFCRSTGLGLAINEAAKRAPITAEDNESFRGQGDDTPIGATPDTEADGTTGAPLN
ncbi:hypothetical protein NOCA2360009 [metagenome]|uniref:Uncharacterized protein n=1 Tax=metagenome TaxID=256318 RepID=A0A2P2C3U9_9ZZZZ